MNSSNSNEISSIHDQSKIDEINERTASLSTISNKYIRELAIQEGISNYIFFFSYFFKKTKTLKKKRFEFKGV